MSRLLLALLVAAPAAPAVAAEPVTVVLPERATCPAAVATVGHIATVTGPAEWKKAVAAIDVADMPVRDNTATVTRRQVEIRLQMAGLQAGEFRVLGAEKVTITADRKPVPVEDVVLAAKAAVLNKLPYPADEVVLDLVQQVVAKMPEVGKTEAVDIRAEPHGNSVQMGRLQVNVAIFTRGSSRLTLPVFLEARRLGQEPPTARPLPGAAPAGEVLVKARQRITITTTVGELRLSAWGESQQDGKLGQTIRVRNVDSNRVLTARVTGPGVVLVD